MTFSRQGHLTNHFQQKHSGITVKCPLCEYTAPRMSVQNHLKKKHGIVGSKWNAKETTFILPDQS